jgi:F-box-like
MDSLPTELILLVFRCLDKIDMKSLRLVSRRFGDIALSTLFTSVKVSPSVKHFEVLRSVADHPIISRCIRQIIYIESDFCRHVRLITEDGMLHLSYPESQMQHETAAYKSLILQSDVHVNTIANALSKMPNVREAICRNVLSLDVDSDGSDIYFIPEFNRATICDPRISRLYPKAGENQSRAAHVNNLYRDEVKNFCYPNRFNYGLSILCRAISISNTHLQTLSLGCHDRNKLFDKSLYDIYPATFVLMSPRELEHTCIAFQYLRKIYLSFKFRPGGERDRSSITGNGIGENVARMLAAAKNLRDLRLDFNEVRLEHGCFTLKEYLGSCTWPQLQSIHLYEKNVKEEELTDLIYRHRSTLKYLSLKSVNLVDADWWTLARQIQPWVKLCSSFEEIKCYRLRQETGVHWMCNGCLGNYLLQGKDGLCPLCRTYRKYLIRRGN